MSLLCFRIGIMINRQKLLLCSIAIEYSAPVSRNKILSNSHMETPLFHFVFDKASLPIFTHIMQDLRQNPF